MKVNVFVVFIIAKSPEFGNDAKIRYICELIKP